MQLTDLERNEIQNLLYGYDCEYIPELKEATNKIFDYVQKLVGQIEPLVKPKIAGIQWESRYSTTLKDDERGRWMRIGRINGMTVAIILKAKERFLIKLPNNKGDESLENCIIATDLGQGMLDAEKYIAKYVSNFSV
jgi:hypothetical protein